MTARRWGEAVVGLVYLGLVGALIALSIMVYNKDFSDKVRVTVRADAVGSALQQGSDVKVRGVFAGTVTGVNTDGDGADIHLDISPTIARQLPANVSAQLIPKTLFGERFVALELPGSPETAHLHSGDVIQQDRSAGAVELEHLFSDLLPVLQAVQPQKLSATLSELAGALRGRGQDLAQTMTTVGAYLGRLGPSIPALTDDIAAFAKVAQTYTDAAPNLISALDSLSTTSSTLVAERAQFAQLLTEVTTTGNTLGDFVGSNSDTLIGLANDSLPSLRLLAKYSPEYPCLSKALAGFIPTADRAFGVGTGQPGAHVVLHVVPASAEYTTADLPRYTDVSGPRCPVMNGSAATLPATAIRTAAAATRTLAANSVGENELINELFAGSATRSPAAMPAWSSLLLGPLVRGAEVSVR